LALGVDDGWTEISGLKVVEFGRYETVLTGGGVVPAGFVGVSKVGDIC
jgi:hypothetical protein